MPRFKVRHRTRHGQAEPAVNPAGACPLVVETLPEVRARLRQAAIYGPVDDNPDELPARGYCVCGHPYYWLADELAHPALACYEGTA